MSNAKAYCKLKTRVKSLELMKEPLVKRLENCPTLERNELESTLQLLDTRTSMMKSVIEDIERKCPDWIELNN